MKYSIVTFLLFLTAHVHAQVMQSKTQWATIRVPQLKCWECEERLEHYLIREKGPGTDAGIIQWKMDLRNATIKIQFLPDRMPLVYIQTAIANAGFDADTVTAEPDSYKLLPPPCKKASDGNGFGPFKYCALAPADRPKE